MYDYGRSRNNIAIAGSILRLIFVNTVREIRKTNGSPLKGLLINVLQSLVMVIVFFFMFTLMGVMGSAIRGDFILYIMSGIFLFMTHNKAMGAIVGSGGSTSGMIMHAPMNTMIAMCSAALGALYLQVLTVIVILGAYSLFMKPIEIYDPAGTFGMFVMSWASGCALGTVVLAARPWAPQFVTILQTFYMRANMVSSGKMFVANSMPSVMLALFSWNPLFHCIDQARGFAFVHYEPRNSSIEYAVGFTITCFAIGLLGEFFTRKRESQSWAARD